jgi:hypothetical protein
MHTQAIVQAAPLSLPSGVIIPDSKMACEATELVRDTESLLLVNHSCRATPGIPRHMHPLVSIDAMRETT